MCVNRDSNDDDLLSVESLSADNPNEQLLHEVETMLGDLETNRDYSDDPGTR